MVAENGAVIDAPAGPLQDTLSDAHSGDARERIQRALAQLRAQLGVTCRAFFELGVDGIAAATGLSLEQARLANARQASEPLLWTDTDDALAAFARAADTLGLRAVRGGRFVHLMPPTDKADAMRKLLVAYAGLWPDTRLHSVALGDSPNDLEMLRAADTAVIVPNRRDGGTALADALADHPNVIRAPHAGPTGWHAAMQSILANTTTEYVNVG